MGYGSVVQVVTSPTDDAPSHLEQRRERSSLGRGAAVVATLLVIVVVISVVARHAAPAGATAPAGLIAFDAISAWNATSGQNDTVSLGGQSGNKSLAWPGNWTSPLFNPGEGAASDSQSDDTWLAALNAVADTYTAHCNVDSALCDIATCTLNADKVTASCGCMRMPGSANNPAKLQLGWGSAVLSHDPVYRAAVLSCSSGVCSNETLDTLCNAIEQGQLWPDLDVAEGGYGVSLYSSDPLYSSITEKGDLFTCPDAMVASCMGAPCYDAVYDKPTFDLTCVCPVLEGSCKTSQIEGHSDGWLCREISAKGKMRSCAASCFGDYRMLETNSSAQLNAVIAALEQAVPAGDNSTCPTYGSHTPYWSGAGYNTTIASTLDDWFDDADVSTAAAR